MTITKNTFRALAYRLSKHLPLSRSLSDLEKISTESLLFYGDISVIPAFQKVAKTLPFYRKILESRNINPMLIRTLEDFYTLVPIIKKEDVFPLFTAQDICQNGDLSDMHSAIVTSGTSGVFAYGILTEKDIAFQKKMIDEMMDYFYDAKNQSVLIINALAMGVNFSSSYPVINTSVRSDIVIHLIKTFNMYYKRIVVITDPNFAKKIIEGGIEKNIDWKNISTSFIVGGTSSSSSLQTYMLTLLNNKESLPSPKNTIQGTMGLTEIGLNIFTAPKELISVRSSIETNEILRKKLFGETSLVCPELFYYYPTSTHIEIHNPDEQGFGSIVISNLDTLSKTPLFRYNTGDIGKKLNRADFLQQLHESGITATLPLQLPLIAIKGREQDETNSPIAPSIVKEALYRDHAIAMQITGHFKIDTKNAPITVIIQAKKNISNTDEIALRLANTLKEITSAMVIVACVPYYDFGHHIELDYESKWKHLH